MTRRYPRIMDTKGLKCHTGTIAEPFPFIGRMLVWCNNVWGERYMINDQEFQKITEQLYESVFDSQKLDGVLASMSGLLNSSYSTLLHQDPNSGLAELVASSNIDANSTQLYEEHYGPISPLLPYAKEYGVGDIFTEEMVPDSSVYHKSEAYNDFFRPSDSEHLLQTMLSKDPSNVTTIVFRRGSKLGPYSLDELNDFKRIIPHLRQATRITQKFSKEKQTVTAFTGTLEHLKDGVLLFDRWGRIVFYNRSAKEILDNNDGIEIDREGRCVISLSQEMAAFSQLLRQACRRGFHDHIHPGVSLRLSRPSLKPPYCICISPMLQADIGDNGQAVAIAFISDPNKPHSLLPQVISQQFGLTPAETRLAIALVNGQSLSDASEELEWTKSTTRSTLKIIFSKTNTNRQAALVSLLLKMPTIRN